MIAASLIQPQWHGSETDLARYALIQADALIKESGCIVEGAEAPEYAMD